MTLKQSWRKPLLLVALLIVAGMGVFFLSHTSRKVKESQNIEQVSLATFKEDEKTVNIKRSLPDFNNPTGTGTPIEIQVMEWNSQFPLMLANGGVMTSKGSLFDSAKLNVKIIRQDDCNLTVKSFIANAKALHDGTTKTPLFICFMADGVPGFSTALKEVAKIDKSYAPKVVYFMGRSAGEDCFWGPSEWKSHPKQAIGKCVLGVERDGDMNIVLEWASMNDIVINADTKYYDSSALNIMGANDFNDDLCKKVIGNYTEEREVKSHGKTIPGLKHTCTVDAFTTWTPADVTVAKKKGGFTRLASTKEFTAQMPNAMIVLNSWAETHVEQMHSLIKALGEAGDQVKSFPEAQEFAAKVSAKVYADKDAGYWLKYYRGSTENDMKQNQVQLGGSQAFNLADAANMFGLGKDQNDRYKITYETFGTILFKLYPKEMNGYIKYDDMVDKSYLAWVLEHNLDLKNGVTESDKQEYASSNIVTDQTGSKAYNISFIVGKSDIQSKSFPMLTDIYNNAVIAEAQTVFVYGHTDNTGNEQANQVLSEARAEAVKSYLINKLHLKASRVQAKGLGSSQPIDGTTASDVANRCVEIKIGS